MGSLLPSLKRFARRFINFGGSSLFQRKTQCPSRSPPPLPTSPLVSYALLAPHALPGSPWFQVLVMFSSLPVYVYILPLPGSTLPGSLSRKLPCLLLGVKCHLKCFHHTYFYHFQTSVHFLTFQWLRIISVILWHSLAHMNH